MLIYQLKSFLLLKINEKYIYIYLYIPSLNENIPDFFMKSFIATLTVGPYTERVQNIPSSF